MTQTLLITGSTGIAAATAALWTSGPVFVVSNDREACETLCAALPDAAYAVADVRDETAVMSAVSTPSTYRTVWPVAKVR